jgi:hypothetical protein
MIPQFPNFAKLDVSHRYEINNFINNFAPYCDFNFMYLWIWDVRNKYPGQPKEFFTFLGKNNINKTVSMLMNYGKNLGWSESDLYLIPEIVARKIDRDKYMVSEDRDYFDYIYSVAELISLKDAQYKRSRKAITKFTKLYGNKTEMATLNLEDKVVQKTLLELFFRWEKAGGKNRTQTAPGLRALKRIFKYANFFHPHTIGVYVEGELAGFAIYDVTNHEYGLGYFEIADTSFKNIFSFLKLQKAIDLKKHGCRYYNSGFDEGIEGLRKVKLHWRPVKFLKKYIISINE